MTRDLVLVLEDSVERVTWLRAVLAGTGLDIEVHDTVAPFVAAVSCRRDRLALVVFDHDLGHLPPQDLQDGVGLPRLANYDVDGKTGEDAAKAVGPLPCPALVWSWNTRGRVAIGRALRDHGNRGRLAPFTSSPEYAALVAGVLSEGPR